MTEYLDDFLSINTANPAFFGDKSLVMYAANGTALNCGSFRLLEGSGQPVTVPFIWPSTIHLSSTATTESVSVSVSMSATSGYVQAMTTGAASDGALTTPTATNTPAPFNFTACHANQTASLALHSGGAIHYHSCIPHATHVSGAIVGTAKYTGLAAMYVTDTAPISASAVTTTTTTADTEQTLPPSVSQSGKRTQTASAHLRYPKFKHNSDSHGAAVSVYDGRKVLSGVAMAGIGALFALFY